MGCCQICNWSPKKWSPQTEYLVLGCHQPPGKKKKKKNQNPAMQDAKFMATL